MVPFKHFIRSLVSNFISRSDGVWLEITSAELYFLDVIEFGFPYQDWIMVCRLITQEGEEMTANMTSKNDLLPNAEPSFHG